MEVIDVRKLKKHECQFCSAYFYNYEDFYNHEYEHIKKNRHINFRTPLLLTLWIGSIYSIGIWLGHDIASSDRFWFKAVFSIAFFMVFFFFASLLLENIGDLK